MEDSDKRKALLSFEAAVPSFSGSPDLATSWASSVLILMGAGLVGPGEMGDCKVPSSNKVLFFGQETAI